MIRILFNCFSFCRKNRVLCLSNLMISKNTPQYKIRCISSAQHLLGGRYTMVQRAYMKLNLQNDFCLNRNILAICVIHFFSPADNSKFNSFYCFSKTSFRNDNGPTVLIKLKKKIHTNLNRNKKILIKCISFCNPFCICRGASTTLTRNCFKQKINPKLF